MTVRNASRLVRTGIFCLALAATACGQNPESTEKARGVLKGTNTVLALSIVFIVLAGGLIVGAVALDRLVRSRKALETAEPEAPEEEEGEEVVAGITVGRAGVPRWLYAFYVLIPLFALLYVFNNVALRPQAQEKPAATKAPSGPVKAATIVGSGIKFDLSKLTMPAQTDVSVTFDNKDGGVPHNFTVWPNEAAAQGSDTSKAIHPGKTITGVSNSTEKFKTPGAGTLYFDCTIHPTSMFGTIEVVAGQGK